jgi:hypothetical protein
MAGRFHSRATISRPPPHVSAERRPQYLPIPLGDLRPARRLQRRRMTERLWRRYRAELVAVLGILLAATAALVSIARPTDSVYLRGDRVYVDGVALVHPPGNAGVATGRVYEGPATLVIVTGSDGLVTASAVTFLGTEKVTAVCRLDPPASGELLDRCQLQIGRSAVRCRDTMPLDSPGTWDRRCSDGRHLSIAVPSGAALIPMPFPLGEP